MKIAIPQDEFLHSDLLNEFINEFGMNHILSCADEPDWPLIYNGIDRSRVKRRTILTGYINIDVVKKVSKQRQNASRRPIDIGYRALKAEYWLGEHGAHKVRLADVFEDMAKELGLRTDISLRQEDVISGDKWFDFLLNCKATPGVEGGASVLDRDGTVKSRIEGYLDNHPKRTSRKFVRLSSPIRTTIWPWRASRPVTLRHVLPRPVNF